MCLNRGAMNQGLHRNRRRRRARAQRARRFSKRHDRARRVRDAARSLSQGRQLQPAVDARGQLLGHRARRPARRRRAALVGERVSARVPRAVEKYQALGKNPEGYLYSIMRKESGFDPHDLSYADAQGLLQMIPPTTMRVAKALGIPYDPGKLYEPEYNIQTGSWYIGHLLAEVQGPDPARRGLVQQRAAAGDEVARSVRRSRRSTSWSSSCRTRRRAST